MSGKLKIGTLLFSISIMSVLFTVAQLIAVPVSFDDYLLVSQITPKNYLKDHLPEIIIILISALTGAGTYKFVLWRVKQIEKKAEKQSSIDAKQDEKIDKFVDEIKQEFNKFASDQIEYRREMLENQIKHQDKLDQKLDKMSNTIQIAVNHAGRLESRAIQMIEDFINKYE